MFRVFVIGSFISLLSCSPSAKPAEQAEPECECDRDCANGEGVCDDGACLPVCNDDGDPCSGGGSDCECADPFRMPNLCADESARRTPLAVRIESTSTATEDCEGNTPGPELFAVALEDADGATLGWGRHVGDDAQVQGNDLSNVQVLDGTEREFEDGCPVAGDEGAIALGCPSTDHGAFVAVDFPGVELSNDPETEYFLSVYEADGACGIGDSADSYSVTICPDYNAVTNDFDYRSCTIVVVENATTETRSVLPVW